MRKILTFLFLLVSLIVYSQKNGINFQGVGRNSSGAVLASTKLTLRFTVLQASETGTIEYVESKEVLTNAQGIFSTVIGDGTQSQGAPARECTAKTLDSGSGTFLLDKKATAR